MKLKTLLLVALCMLYLQLNDSALARKLQLTQVPAAHEDARGKQITKGVFNNKDVQNIAMMMKDHLNLNDTHQHKKITRRALSRKPKKERVLAIDEVDYAGPRTHPPTKPPKK